MSFVLEHDTTTPTRAPGETAPSEPSSGLDPSIASKLRRANIAAGLFHLAQSVVFLVIVTSFELPIVTSFLTEDPALTDALPPREVWTDVTVGYGVAAFSLLSAFFHFLVATAARSTYERAIAQQQNPFRWIEYSLSATLMIVLVSMLLGVYDIGALIGIAAANVSMMLFGWLMERHNTPGAEDIDWYPFVFGCIAGAAPWLIGTIYFAGALGNAEEAVPVWIWAVFFSLFALFNSFALNQWLQYRAIGPWRRYVFGEYAYIALSFVAKSALMWQLYSGTTR